MRAAVAATLQRMRAAAVAQTLRKVLEKHTTLEATDGVSNLNGPHSQSCIESERKAKQKEKGKHTG